MVPTYLSYELARQRQAELIRQAERDRLARAVRDGRRRERRARRARRGTQAGRLRIPAPRGARRLDAPAERE